MTRTYTPFLTGFPAEAPFMWVYNPTSQEVLDATPATTEMLQAVDKNMKQRTLSREHHLDLAHSVLTSGERCTVFEWMNYSNRWLKFARAKSRLEYGLVFEVATDITHLDPRTQWLARINLRSQRLELDKGESISFEEFTVLHFLIRGYPHRKIAEDLHVSAKTVEYRIGRLKASLNAESVAEMMNIVVSSGLISLTMVPLDPENPAKTEVELYKLVKD